MLLPLYERWQNGAGDGATDEPFISHPVGEGLKELSRGISIKENIGAKARCM